MPGGLRLRGGVRLLASELSMLARRRRNQLILLVLIAIPVIIGIAVKATGGTSGRGRGGGPNGGLLADVTGNGIFVAFVALAVVLPLFLPMAVSVVVGESVAGEASAGTLRYLLVVPVGRSVLLAVKYVAVMAWCLVTCLAVAVAGVVTGLVLFSSNRITLLSGTQVSFVDACGRLVVAVGYAALMMIALAAVGLFVSTLTEVPVAAMATTLTVAIVEQVLEAVPQVSAVHPWLISHYLLVFADVLRDPVSYTQMGRGCLLALAYLAVFCSLAWARFGSKDVTS